jgi:large subunit ribosomal protein L29
MNIRETRELNIEELHQELDRLRRHLFDLRSQAVTEKLEDPTQLTKTKREIARVLTVLQERGETDIEQKQYHLETVARQRGKQAQ